MTIDVKKMFEQVLQDHVSFYLLEMYFLEVVEPKMIFLHERPQEKSPGTMIGWRINVGTFRTY